MKNSSVRFLFALLAFMTLSVAAQAQATRTWVSGVGDDANPCSRTAPCKTFAGAISKTATGGEINVLDPGGFGGVTITKAITIASESVEAGVLVSGTNAIIVNSGTGNVTLRGLDIEGLGTGLSGIRVISVGTLHVEKCTINNFTQKGIDFEPTSAAASTSQIHVTDSIIRNNNGASSGGILVKPGANVSVIGMIENTQLSNNQFGLRVEDRGNVTAKNTSASDSVSGSGFISVSVAAAAVLSLDKCSASGNSFGIRADGVSATTRFGGCSIFGNATGISSANSGKTISFTGTNFNADPGTATGPNIAPQ